MMRRLKCLWILLFCMLGLVGCDTTEPPVEEPPIDNVAQELILCMDYVAANTIYNGDTMTITIPAFYKGPVPKVEVVALEGVNTQNIRATISELDTNAVVDGGYKEYSYGQFNLSLTVLTNTKVELEKIILSVNGEEEAVQIKNGISIEFVEDDHWTGWELIDDLVIPLEYPYDLETLDWSVTLNRAVTITACDLHAEGFFPLEEVEVSVDRSYVGTGDEVFPLEIKKGSTVQIQMRLLTKSQKYVAAMFAPVLWMESSDGTEYLFGYSTNRKTIYSKEEVEQLGRMVIGE